MSVIINIESTDRSDNIVWESLNVTQNLTSQVDSANFKYRKFGDRTWTPSVSDEVEIYDGSTQIFGGTIISMKESIVAGSDGLVYDIKCVDWTHEIDNELVSETYEDKTIYEIIKDIVDNYAPTFTYANVDSTFTIDKIVFNQVTVSSCLKKLADIVKYEWYIDPNKDVHFFSKFTNTAPFDLTDTSGNYVYKSLERNIDGKQLANRVKVRGGEYDADTYEDVITVSGDLTKSFKLPYKFSGLSVWLDVGGGYVAQDVGIDFINDFTTYDVLYNYNDMTIKWETALSDGDKIKFSGNPKVPVLAIASDSTSIAEFGIKEKIIRDTSIEDIATARQRATAELNAYKDEIDDATFRTYTSGLRTGMTINLTSTVRGSIDVNYIIKKVDFKMIDPNTFGYNVGVVTTRKYGLIELLQKLLEPDATQADEGEVSETIETDIVDVTITELIEVTSAVTDIIGLTIVEDIEKDPLGADTSPDWVLAPYVPEDPDTKADWRFDDLTGLVLTDYSHNENNGTLVNTPTWGKDEYVGGYLDFDGVNQYVNCGADTSLNFGDGSTDSPFSISVWVNMDDATNFIICSKGNGGVANSEYWFYTDNTDKLYLALFDASTGGWIGRKYNTTLTSYEGENKNIVATYDGVDIDGIKIYINGLRVDDTNLTNGSYTAMEDTSNNLLIGKIGALYANGKMSKVKIFSKALSTDEITALYNDPFYKLPGHEDTKRVGRLNYSLQVY